MIFYTSRELMNRWKLKRQRTIYDYGRKGLRSKLVGGRRLYSETAVLDFENGKNLKGRASK